MKTVRRKNPAVYHEPVLVQEILKYLLFENPNLRGKAGVFIDATLGTGGHSLEIIKNGSQVLGIEVDPKVLEIAKERISGGKFVHGNFSDIAKIAVENGFDQVDGILFDLGVSNLHLTDALRGFSFRNPEAPLDMRLSSEEQAVTGADLLNGLRRDQLTDLFSRVLKVFLAKKLAAEVVRFRSNQKITKVADFLAICQVVKGKPGIHPATLPFLALRMAVNGELENLKEALPQAFSLLTKSGRILVITFHSAEGLIVNDYAKEIGKNGVGKLVTPEPVRPTDAEINNNPRSRSAKLWVFEKIKN